MALFVCSHCGRPDSPIWKSAKWLRYSVYCHFSEVETFYPQLAKQLKDSEDLWLHEGPYYYKLTKSGLIVYRMTEMGLSEFKTHGFTEKRKRHIKGRQLKLTSNYTRIEAEK